MLALPRLQELLAANIWLITGKLSCISFLWLLLSRKQKLHYINADQPLSILLYQKSASKFAVVGLMESLDKEIHDRGANENVRLTTVCPSSISTGMFQNFTSRFEWLLPVLKADQVAERVVDAVLTNKSFIAIPPVTLFFYRLSSIIPTRVIYLVQDYLNYGVKPHSSWLSLLESARIFNCT